MENLKIITIITAMFLLTACTHVEQQNTGVQATTSALPMVDTEPLISHSPSPNALYQPLSELTTPLYNISAKTYQKGNVSIEYPQITGLGDSEKENAINELIENSILMAQSGEQNVLTITMKYYITFSTDELLSIIYTGTSHKEGGMFPYDMFSGITIDLEKVKQLYVTDFVNIDDEIIKEIRQSKSISNQVYTNNVDNGDLIFLISLKDDEAIIRELEYLCPLSLFYVTPDAIGLMLNGVHAGGDYILVEVPW